MFWETNSLRMTMQIVECSLLHRRACCRKGDPFQGPKLGSCLTLGNELSKETHVLTEQEILLGKGTQVESSRVREKCKKAKWLSDRKSVV